MKSLFSSLALALIIYAGAFASSLFTGVSTPKSALEIQLAKQITYPAAMLTSTHGGTVMIQFQLDETNHLEAVKVFTENAQLNAELTKQLTGLKVSRSGLHDEKRYIVRVRFSRTV